MKNFKKDVKMERHIIEKSEDFFKWSQIRNIRSEGKKKKQEIK